MKQNKKEQIARDRDREREAELTHLFKNKSFFSTGSFSQTSCVALTFIRGVSLRYPVLASFLSGEFLLHIPCWLHFYLGCFSYTSGAGFIFMRGVSLTYPMLASFFLLFLKIFFI